MPQKCCVPECRKKCYVENGLKISYFKFPEEKDMFKKWIVAIRRDVGEDFQGTEHTRVCSRHFKQDDFKLSFAKRKRDLKFKGIPSVFASGKESPVEKEVTDEKISRQVEKGDKNNETKVTTVKTIASVDIIESGDFLTSTCSNMESDTIESNCLNLETYHNSK